MQEAKFIPIDLQTWNRGGMFYYFSQMAPTGYSLTVKVDVTKLKVVYIQTIMRTLIYLMQ